MKNAAERIVGPCVLCGRYFYSNHKTRPPKYCWECAEFARKENNKNRQRAWRDRQKQRGGEEKTVSAKSGNGKRGTSPSLWGQGQGTASLGRAPLRGMYADLPIGDANERRRRVGLPALKLAV